MSNSIPKELCKSEKIAPSSIVRSLLLLFLAALFVRIVGILWGGAHPDENISMSVKVLVGQLVPDQLYYPPLLNYINALAFAIMYGIGRLFGVWWSLGDFRAQYFENPMPFIFAGRFVTACLGATAAPLATMIARCFNVQWRLCLVVGGLAALLPLNILLSHISKSDVGMTSALMLLIWALLRKLDCPNSKTADVLIGLSIALSMSFKHSAVFMIAPLGLGFIVCLKVYSKAGYRQITQSVAIALGSSVLLWIPLNIGILMDLQNFLEFQKVQSLIALRDQGFLQSLSQWLMLQANIFLGASIPVLLMWLFIPIIRRDIRTLWIWTSTVFSLFMILSIVGNRLPRALFLPHIMIMLVLSGIAAATLLESAHRWRSVKAVPLIVMLTCVGVGAVGVVYQSITPPLNRQVAIAITELAKPESTRILSGFRLPNWLLPIDPMAEEDTYQRHLRLAKKYGVTLPPKAPEKISKNLSSNQGYYIRSFPGTFGGLEVYDEEEITEIKPFAWPLQKEEWQLSYWVDKGFTIFIVANEEARLQTSTIPYRQFHEQIRERCELLKVLPSKKPLFFEKEVKIYKCG